MFSLSISSQKIIGPKNLMPEEQKQGHNNFVIEQLSDINVVRDLFQNYLPKELSEAIDWEFLRLAPSSFIQKSLQKREGDRTSKKSESSDGLSSFSLYGWHLGTLPKTARA